MHLVLGATGGFGGAMVRSLLARGLPVRALVRNPDRARLPGGIQVIQGDATKLGDLVEAAKGCESITHALNLPYHQWQPGMLDLTDRVVEASGMSGATIVFPGNIYGLKPIYRVPLPPNAPTRDVSDRPNRKGLVRNMLEDHLAQHSELKNIRSIVVRAGDFYGPGVDNGLLGPMFRAALTGKPIPWYGRRDTPHEFAYVDDVAEVAAGLLLRTDRPSFEIVGVSGHAFTGDAWAAALGGAAGRSASIRPVPAWQVRLMGLINRDAYEFAELLYQWEDVILLDDTKTRTLLPDWRPVPTEVAIKNTMAWFRA